MQRFELRRMRLFGRDPLPTRCLRHTMINTRHVRMLAVSILAAASGLASVARSSAGQAIGTAVTGQADRIELHVGGAKIRVTLDADQYPAGTDELIEWAGRSASIVAGYYGAFPVSTLEINIMSVDGTGVRNGRAEADPTPTIRVTVGRQVTKAELLSDWVLVHEMTHLALPEVGRAHAWLAEGLATYVEGVARVQAGNLSARELWQEDVAAMPKGMPAAGDAGLDHTHTWGRTYWGGALFCLAADVGIRERSGNKHGLQDALRAVARQSGGMITSWPVERVFSTGDAATGTTVLAETYALMRNSPAGPDPQELWRRLGIRVADGVLQLDTGSRQAEIREAITRRPPE
jgi:hypothetical protein